MANEEVWKPIQGFEGLYEVSFSGRVRALDRVVTRKNGAPMPIKGRVLKHQRGSKGHHYVSLWRSGINSKKTVHRLVAETFIPNPESKPFALHRDDNKEDNSVNNLYWGSASENNRDRVRNGKDFNRNKTHCLRGREYDDENTYQESKGSRRCRACQTLPKTHLDVTHGTTTGYKYYRCRCNECRAAVAAQAREYRKRVRERK